VVDGHKARRRLLTLLLTLHRDANIRDVMVAMKVRAYCFDCLFLDVLLCAPLSLFLFASVSFPFSLSFCYPGE